MQEHCRTIGETAGKIYRVLEKRGCQTAVELHHEIRIQDDDLFNQALGWLAREGKISFEKEGRLEDFLYFFGCLLLSKEAVKNLLNRG